LSGAQTVIEATRSGKCSNCVMRFWQWAITLRYDRHSLGSMPASKQHIKDVPLQDRALSKKFKHECARQRHLPMLQYIAANGLGHCKQHIGYEWSTMFNKGL
jgi:hypothetical protein